MDNGPSFRLNMTAPTPFLLRADNFTPAARTPWGGHHLANHYKFTLLDDAWRGQPIGESWELSAGDELGSTDTHGATLRDRLASNPDAFLGDEAKSGANTTALLVKLLDAADDLSVQIHPFDHDPQLAPDEAGKSEAWLVIRADEDAAIYLGLREGVDEARMRHVLETGGDASALLRRWSVRPGDFFVVEPGTPHAIGRGVTLVEPQTATAGKRALTYRYWDWNRRYDQEGKLDPAGQPRPLHVERALAVTNWPKDTPVDPPWVRLGPANLHGPATWQPLCGPENAPCPSYALRVGQLRGEGTLGIPDWNVLRGLTVLEGRVTLEWNAGRLDVNAGQTAVLPACATSLKAQLTAAHAVLSACATS